MLAKLKAFVIYALILGAGLGIGYVAAHLKEWTKSSYTEGNYAGHFPDTKTKIVLYGTPTCPYCKAAREYFARKNIAFADLDITNNAQAKEKFAQLDNGDGVPAIIIGNRLITGFNQTAIENAFKTAGIQFSK